MLFPHTIDEDKCAEESIIKKPLTNPNRTDKKHPFLS
jgi:hypothetical protein